MLLRTYWKRLWIYSRLQLLVIDILEAECPYETKFSVDFINRRQYNILLWRTFQKHTRNSLRKITLTAHICLPISSYVIPMILGAPSRFPNISEKNYRGISINAMFFTISTSLIIGKKSSAYFSVFSGPIPRICLKASRVRGK